MTEITWDSITWFSPEEFMCRHCGQNKIDLELVQILDLIRADTDIPMKITSGYRCPAHPVELRKRVPGAHSLGLAADVAVYGERAYRIVESALRHGVTGIGVNQAGDIAGRFVHLDLAQDELTVQRPWLWSYPTT